MRPLRLTIAGVEHAPRELYDQVPFEVALIREVPGADRPDYWLGKVEPPLRWVDDGRERSVEYVVLAARWEATTIAPGVVRLPVGIAFITDESLLSDPVLEMSKCVYVAVGLATDPAGG